MERIKQINLILCLQSLESKQKNEMKFSIISHPRLTILVVADPLVVLVGTFRSCARVGLVVLIKIVLIRMVELVLMMLWKSLILIWAFVIWVFTTRSFATKSMMSPTAILTGYAVAAGGSKGRGWVGGGVRGGSNCQG